MVNNVNCELCGSSRELQTFFRNFDTSDNRRENKILACQNCINTAKVFRANEAVKLLKDLGFKNDVNVKWVYDSKKEDKSTLSYDALLAENRRLKEMIELEWKSHSQHILNKQQKRENQDTRKSR